jgi:hypothetical protein
VNDPCFDGFVHHDVDEVLATMAMLRNSRGPKSHLPPAWVSITNMGRVKALSAVLIMFVSRKNFIEVYEVGWVWRRSEKLTECMLVISRRGSGGIFGPWCDVPGVVPDAGGGIEVED